MTSIDNVRDADHRIKAHTRRAYEELEAALMVSRRVVRMSPKARSLELDLARILHHINDLGSIESIVQMADPIGPAPLSRGWHIARKASPTIKVADPEDDNLDEESG